MEPVFPPTSIRTIKHKNKLDGSIVKLEIVWNPVVVTADTTLKIDILSACGMLKWKFLHSEKQKSGITLRNKKILNFVSQWANTFLNFHFVSNTWSIKPVLPKIISNIDIISIGMLLK